jgi:hypothetical protein
MNLRQLIAICLLSLQLFTGTELCQVFKAPVLLQHYNEHKGGDKHLTFLSFLREHYIDSNEQDPDYARDMQLPFKSGSGVLPVSHSISIPVSNFTIVPPLTTFEIEKQYPCFQSIRHTAPMVHSIFQPPRLA